MIAGSSSTASTRFLIGLESVIAYDACASSNTVSASSTLTLIGPEFAFRSLTLGDSAKVLFQSPTKVFIEEGLDVTHNSDVGPAYPGIAAREIILYVGGTNPDPSDPDSEPAAAVVDKNSLISANFYVPNGLERFRKLYVAAFGAVAAGSPDQTVTLNDLAAGLVGNDTVWSTYSWRRDKKNPDDIIGNLGYNFDQDPSNLKEPVPFAVRDAA